MVAENLDHESRCRCINTSDVLKPRDLSRWPYVSDAEEQSHSPETLGGGGGAASRGSLLERRLSWEAGARTIFLLATLPKEFPPK